jgi:hypothetical protein
VSNLLEETLDAIRHSGHTPDDIIFIGSVDTGHSCTWEEYQRLADVEYDSGFGAAEVASDLQVVFRDGVYLYRSEYDGSENWAWAPTFQQPERTLPIERLVGRYWPSMTELHDPACAEHNWPEVSR